MHLIMGRFMRANDERVRVANETLQGMRTVKFTGLEDTFVGRVALARAKQCLHLYAQYMTRSAFVCGRGWHIVRMVREPSPATAPGHAKALEGSAGGDGGAEELRRE